MMYVQKLLRVLQLFFFGGILAPGSRLFRESSPWHAVPTAPATNGAEKMEFRKTNLECLMESLEAHALEQKNFEQRLKAVPRRRHGDFFTALGSEK